MSICIRPGCNNEYTVKDNQVDDGLCSNECWEIMNCSDPEEPQNENIFEGIIS